MTLHVRDDKLSIAKKSLEKLGGVYSAQGWTDIEIDMHRAIQMCV
jgi:hypothetical protein